MIRRGNLLLVALVSVAGIAAIAAEGYRPHVDAVLLTFTAVAVGLATLGATRVSPRRLAVLLAVAALEGLATQVAGTRSGAWSFPMATYGFAAPSFAIAGIAIFALATQLAPRLPRIPGRVLIVVPLLVVAAGAPAGAAGWCALLAVIAALLYRRSADAVLPVVLSAAAFGGAAEYVGSRAGLWSFPSGHPPLWLVLGSWPLEGLVHVGVSAWLTGEPALTSPAASSATGAGAAPDTTSSAPP